MGSDTSVTFSSRHEHLRSSGLVGVSAAFRATIDKARRVAAYDLPVLLIGETGTGKELFARTIHYSSRRSQGPLIPINCGAIPDELFENELFGHERGAFTDAREPLRGLITQADGGTLFLDEVECLSHSAQAKLLRFLEDRHIKPLGSSAPRLINTRLVVASNENLEKRVRKRTFREDLFYRLRVISISLPPLRERREDIELLALHFIRRTHEEFGTPLPVLSAEAVKKLAQYDWPGNVRELKNAVQAAAALCCDGVIEAADLEITGAPVEEISGELEPMRLAKARLIRTFEIDYLQKAIAAARGNISEAARSARKNRRAFFALLKKYGMTSAVTPE
ncbi:MAG TPA: sigma-54 dependent transcriptional regulator [Bryobacteraceae bacterium]